MNIAVVVEKLSGTSEIPEFFEDGKYIIVADSDTMSVVYTAEKSMNPEFVAKLLADKECEAIISGPYKTPEMFEAIADKQITRYRGDGLEVPEAVIYAVANQLPILTDYIGGTGCSDNDAHDACHCGHDEEEDEEAAEDTK